ncbi:MAG: chromosomal replication initiator protein DnaA [Bacteroidales bacterium]|nr:chromosomal replication initiator protein DnaA [Candidatus Colimorpha merdihippi]MCQ2282910.1 chromosomal replication initiator protein DnaA [Bacteroidales bacterium]
MEKDCQRVWEECLAFIKDNLVGKENEKVFTTWFGPIVPLRLDGSNLLIQVPSQFFYEWLEENYAELLKEAIRLTLGKNASLQYSIVMDTSISESPITTQVPANGRQTTVNRPKEFPIDVNIGGNREFPNPFVIPGIQKVRINSQLSSNYTLHNYVEGECNRLARAAGLAVAENPGKTCFNPLMIHGGVGLGKTHLANAIGLKTKELHPEVTVLYVTSEQFMQQYQDAGRNGTTSDFVHFYEMVDVLIVDDIQFWANKANRTQEAFFHIFNSLHQAGKQIIITSDKAPSDLQGLEDRLTSRLKWGLAAELLPPDVETRMAILRQKLKNDGVEMSDDVIEYIAYNINTNVRELEGALISLMAQSSLNHRDITIDLTRQMIDKFVKSTNREVTIEYIQKVVCDYFNIPIDSIQSRTRKREIVQARQLTMYFAKKMTKSSLAIIGLQCGNKDHATVLHACKTVANLAETDKQFRYWIDDLEKRFKE